MAWDGPKWGREGLFAAANPDLADILGDLDFYFENFHFLYLFDESPWTYASWPCLCSAVLGHPPPAAVPQHSTAQA